jgi:hypothetical protein
MSYELRAMREPPQQREPDLPCFEFGSGCSKLAAHSSKLIYFSFGGNVSPKTEIIPCPATFTFASAGFGK